LRSIGDKKLLLVLDNCEHLIDAVATLAETLLVHCPQATIIATSRETLSIAGEQVYRVPPLEVPAAGRDDPNHILSHGAVELFIARTKALDSGFSPRTDELPSIGAICRHLDGIPLAIEFAAAHAAVLGMPHVVAGLRDRFALLTSGRRGVMQRHRTLRATLDWSYDLLPETERLLLRYLAAFSGGFSIDAAVAVVTDTGLDRTTVTDCISILVSKSLLALDRSAPDSRWCLLETIRAYAMEKLSERGEYPATARRHAEYFRDLIVPVAVDSKVRLDASNGSRCGRELDNVRAALVWAFSPEGDTAIGVTLTAAFAPIWVHLSLVGECCERVEQLRAIQQTGIHLSAPLERRMCIAYSMSLTMTLGSLERNRAAVIRAQELAEGIGDIDLQVHLLWPQWAVETNSGDYVTALVTAQRLAEVAERGSDATRLLGDRYLGTSLFYAGRLDEARERLQRVIDGYVAPKDGHYAELFIYAQRLLARSTSARVLCLLGYVDQASAEARLCFEEASAGGAGIGSCRLLQDGVWPVALITGDLVTAARATATMIDWATTIDAPLWKMVGNCSSNVASSSRVRSWFPRQSRRASGQAG
jgi:predicted ATPase